MLLDPSILHASPFYELTALLVLAAIVGFIGLLSRQPMIVSYIAVGVLAGPSVLGIVKSNDSIERFAELSVAVLLFLVGMKLDLKQIRNLGPVSLVTGLGQVIFTSLIGFCIVIALGLDVGSSFYVAVALTFSSTIIIVKLLSDKREVDSLHGRIAIGFLIVQDLFVVLVMMVVSTIEGGGGMALAEANAMVKIGTVVMYGMIILALVYLFIRYLATPLTKRIIQSPELTIIFAISWAALLAVIGSHLGFSKELGGLLAGISLASTPFRGSIVSRLSPVRDFLLLFFFISLGSQLDLDIIGTQVFPAIVLSLFVLIGNPLIVMIIMGYMGYRKRTGLLAGLTVAQISEFSLIFMAMGLSFGHVSKESLGLVTLVGLITIAFSVYMITYSHAIYNWLEPALGKFERKVPNREKTEENERTALKSFDVILFGLGRYGEAIGSQLRKEKLSILGVDYNPDAVLRWRRLGYDAILGDAWDYEFLSSLPLNGVGWVVSAVPQHDTELMEEDPRHVLIEGLVREKYNGRIAVSTQHPAEVEALKAKGANMVFLPFYDAAERAVERMKEAENLNSSRLGP